MIQITDKSMCCGCSACQAACPKDCIAMREDEEGFLYPSADAGKCVSCSLCEKVCPILHPTPEHSFPQSGYVAQHRQRDILEQSTSGGAFTAVAAWVIRQGGLAFGAAYERHFQVSHCYVESETDLKKFRNSKYVQSRMGDCYRQARRFLEQGRWVCFSGTPCQIEGLSAFLGRQYDRLLLVDVVCHAVPSPLVWRKYLEMRGEYAARADEALFRDKRYGYEYSAMSFRRNGERIYSEGVETDPYLRAFFSDICDRPSCYDCKFKKRYRVSDLTIWDCFSPWRFSKEIDNNRGASRVLAHTNQGHDVLEAMTDCLSLQETPPESLVQGCREMFQSVKLPAGRERFMKDASVLNGSELFEKHFPLTWKTRVEKACRRFLVQTRLYGIAKKMITRLKGR